MIGAVTSFYSPCNYELPRRHFRDTVAWLVSAGVPVAVTQAALPGQEPQPVPSGVRHRVYQDADALFYKENLWNLAVDMLPECDKYVFLDCDIRLTDGWVRAVEETLDTLDVAQPFSRCQWLDKHGAVFKRMKSSGFAIQMGDAPWVHRNHPGFGIAMTSNAYNRLGGVYEHMPAGGGDAGFWLAMSDHPEVKAIIEGKARGHELNVTSPRYREYRANAVAQRLRVGCVQGITATHLWHGDIVNRRYHDRERYFPREENGDAAVTRRPDGLLRYTLPAPQAAEYFAIRQEDG